MATTLDHIKKTLNASQRFSRACKDRLAALNSKERLGYIGCLNDHNLGDLACLDAMRILLPKARLLTSTQRYDERRLIKMGLGLPQLAPHVIMGGGTLINFHRVPGVTQLLDNGCSIYCLGTGAGPCGFPQPDEKALKGWDALVPRIKYFGLRDEASEQRMKNLGASNTYVLGDLALGLAYDRIACEEYRSKIAVVVAEPEPARTDYNPYQGFDALRDAIIQLHAEGFSFVSLCVEPKDIAVASRLNDAVGGVMSDPVHPKTAVGFLKTVEDCTLSLSVRLHGNVLAACAGVPPIAMGYGPKCQSFMQSIGREEWFKDFGDVDTGWIVDRVRSCSAEHREQQRTTLEAAQSYKKRLQQAASVIRQTAGFE